MRPCATIFNQLGYFITTVSLTANTHYTTYSLTLACLPPYVQEPSLATRANRAINAVLRHLLSVVQAGSND